MSSTARGTVLNAAPGLNWRPARFDAVMEAVTTEKLSAQPKLSAPTPVQS